MAEEQKRALGKISALRYQPNRRGSILECGTLRLLEGQGIDGDCHAGGERQLSLISAEAMLRIAAMDNKGLCMGRFVANIVATYEHPHASALNVGDSAKIGEAIIRITHRGKHCYPDQCDISAKGDDCPLQGCLYAIVQKGGRICVGDSLSV